MRWAAALVAVAVLGAGCGDGGGDAGTDLTVLAAASLTEAFTALDAEAHDADLDPAYSFAGTPTLLAQVRQGFPADVVAVPDVDALDALADEGLVGRPVPFARNGLVVVVRSGGRSPVDGVEDLARPGVRVVLAHPSVPAGRHAREALRASGILAAVRDNVVSHEADVKAVAAKVALGEADAGIVYATDVRADERLRTAGAPLDAVATYAAAVVEGSPRSGQAERFLHLLVSGAGATVLAEAGFTPVTRTR